MPASMLTLLSLHLKVSRVPVEQYEQVRHFQLRPSLTIYAASSSLRASADVRDLQITLWA